MTQGAEQFLADAKTTAQAGSMLAGTLPDASIVGIDGPLGAGKTTFVRGLAMALGVPSADISSPSFTIVIEHTLPQGRVLRHVDAWRLGSINELEDLGWDQWAGAPGTLTVIEWASRIENALPATAHRLLLDYAEGSGRVLSAASGEMP